MLNSGSLRSVKNCCWSDKRIFLLVFLSKCTPISGKLLTYLQKFLKNCAKSILLWYSLLVFLSRCFCSLKGTLLPCIRKHYWQRPSLCPMNSMLGDLLVQRKFSTLLELVLVIWLHGCYCCSCTLVLDVKYTKIVDIYCINLFVPRIESRVFFEVVWYYVCMCTGYMCSVEV